MYLHITARSHQTPKHTCIALSCSLAIIWPFDELLYRVTMKRSICNRCHSLRRGVNNACCNRNCASLSSSATLPRLLPSATTLLCNHQQLQQQRSSPLILNKRLFSSLPTTTPSQSNLLPQTEDPYAHDLVPIDFPATRMVSLPPNWISRTPHVK